MITKEPEIKPGEETAIRPMTPEEKERNNPEQDIPTYRIDLKLNEEQSTRLTTDFFVEYDAIVKQLEEKKLPEAWKERDNQYDGTLKQNMRLLFNVHVPQSKIKVNAICRALKEAFLPQDQIADISPRPETATTEGFAASDKQAQFIDYAFDEDIKPEQALDKIAKSAAKKFVGIGKICWEYRVERRRREETYQGKNNIIGWSSGKPIINNEGLEAFLKTYPDAAQKYVGTVKRLINEGMVQIVSSYKDQISNCPKLKYVKIEDFKVDNSCNYQEGLATTHCIGEDMEMSYWELEKKVRDGEFDAEAVKSLYCGSDKTTENPEGLSTDYKTVKYDIIEGTYYFKVNPNDEEETKIKCYFGKKKKILLGVTLFPYYALDTDYLAFYMILNDEGFYGGAKSIMYDLKDSNIAQNALLNLALHGTYARNILTPIIKEGSDMESDFLEKTWREGDPIIVDEMTEDVSKDFGFVQWPQLNTRDLVLLGQILKKQDSESTGVNDAAATGQNDPTDPEAPAAKTIALLEASGINIKEYIKTFLPTFNIFISSVLQLYYQMSQEGRKYKVNLRAGQVTGDTDPFKSITRDEMVAKTNIQARAASFVFEKRNEKIESVTAYNTIKNDPMAMQQPIVQYKALIQVLGSLGPRWKNIADKDFLSPEDFKKQQMQVAINAAMMYFKKLVREAQQTGMQPPIDLKELALTITRAQAESANPALAEARMRQEKSNA